MQVMFWDMRPDKLMKKGNKRVDEVDVVWKPVHVVHLLSAAGERRDQGQAWRLSALPSAPLPSAAPHPAPLPLPLSPAAPSTCPPPPSIAGSGVPGRPGTWRVARLEAMSDRRQPVILADLVTLDTDLHFVTGAADHYPLLTMPEGGVIAHGRGVDRPPVKPRSTLGHGRGQP
jgi:hypothetical protein